MQEYFTHSLYQYGNDQADNSENGAELSNKREISGSTRTSFSALLQSWPVTQAVLL
jgi:hypothetical protein